MSLIPTPLPNGKILNNYAPKPQKTGAYVLSNSGWFYSANPQNYTSPEFKFWKTPDFLREEISTE